jgi:hypothetical protein
MPESVPTAQQTASNTHSNRLSRPALTSSRVYTFFSLEYAFRASIGFGFFRAPGAWLRRRAAYPSNGSGPAQCNPSDLRAVLSDVLSASHTYAAFRQSVGFGAFGLRTARTGRLRRIISNGLNLRHAGYSAFRQWLRLRVDRHAKKGPAILSDNQASAFAF